MRKLFLLYILFFLLSCKKRTYTIYDFDKNIQEKLLNLQKKNILNTCTSELNIEFEDLTFNSIIKLTKSNVPIFRGLGAYLFVKRKDFRINSYFYTLLKDTASFLQTNCTCGFCGGDTFRSNTAEVATNNLKYYWRDKNGSEKIKYYKTLIKSYPNLTATYYALLEIEEKNINNLLAPIKKILFSNKKFIFKETALFALAKCNSKIENLLIRDSLLLNIDSLSTITFDNLNTYNSDEFDIVFSKICAKFLGHKKNGINKFYDKFLDYLKQTNNVNRQKLLVIIWNNSNIIQDKYERNFYQHNFLSTSFKKKSIFYTKFLATIDTTSIINIYEEKNFIKALESNIFFEKNKHKENEDLAPPPPPPLNWDINITTRKITKQGLKKIKSLQLEYENLAKK
jgi:hypothetical protein